MSWGTPEERRQRYESALERSHKERWQARGRARVVHPTRGELVVPCSSPFSALLNAAELWGCCWTELREAQVLAAEEES